MPRRLWGVGGGHLSLEVSGAEGAAVGRPSEPRRPPLAAVQQRCNQRLTGVLLLPRCFCSFSLQVPVSPVARISQVSFSRSPFGAHSGFCVSPLLLSPIAFALPRALLFSIPVFAPPSHRPRLSRLRPALSSPCPLPPAAPSRLCLSHLPPQSDSFPVPLPSPCPSVSLLFSPSPSEFLPHHSAVSPYVVITPSTCWVLGR